MEWKIRNFKSIDEASINLDTSKNAIIAGPNSSGKSSIIQSILWLFRVECGWRHLGLLR